MRRRLAYVAFLAACWTKPQPQPLAPNPLIEPRRESMTQMHDAPACARFDVNDPACLQHCPREAPDGWGGCLKWVSELVAQGYTCTTSNPRACTPPAQPISVCPPTGCLAVKSRIIAVRVVGTGLEVTVGAGSNQGVTKTWRATVLDGDVPVPGGEISLIRVDRNVSVGTVTLSRQQLPQAPFVKLEP